MTLVTCLRTVLIPGPTRSRDQNGPGSGTKMVLVPGRKWSRSRDENGPGPETKMVPVPGPKWFRSRDQNCPDIKMYKNVYMEYKKV